MATSAIRVPYRRDTCLCGCGKIPSQGRLFWWGHRDLVTSDKFDALWKELCENAPACRCGCGNQTRPTFLTIKAWVSSGCQPLYNQYVDGHANCGTNQSLLLTPLERQAILGTLLGDSSIGYPNKYSKSPRLYSTHGYVQKEWAEHKAKFLHRLNAKTRVTTNAGWGEQSIVTATSCNPALRGIHDFVIRDGKKRVSKAWLDSIGDIGLAWWIGDDGSASRKSLMLHTEGYSKEECDIIAKWFCETIGKATVCGKTGRHTIYIASWTQITVGRRAWQYLPECMRYKLAACDPNRPRKRRRCV